SFRGAPPKLKPLDMSQDPACPSGPQPGDAVMIIGGKLADVFVYIKEGVPQGTFAVPTEPAVLDQRGCRYVPHVLGIMTGQQLKILNSDKADHNIHSMSSNNPMWNESQTANSKPVLESFVNPEMMVPVQCNQHPWMRAYINVMSHPYFAVTSADGSFAIKNLPPGEYTLAAVHEKFGEQTLKVKVGPKMDSDARFTFAAQ
ncbi:MAG TPA: carboxypeptidase regulatory-like domain-containing protein, partial [Candidatus Angelobacter sp.]|nr:carboxypeptidase regulatory-like domain-containing protein [Candidatus Angelobacter sp.]